MNIKHHLSDDLILAFSAGLLPEAFSLVIATHVSLCDECRARVETCDAMGGAILDGCSAVAVSDDALQATLAMIKAADEAPAEAPKARENGVFPAPLQEYVGGDLDSVAWRKAGGGVSQAILSTSSEATVRLIRIPPGVAVPDHGHKGAELTLVLQGAFRDEHDRFGRGDVEIADEDLHHTPVAEGEEVCICLAATDAPLKFNAFLPKLAQPFLRI